MIEKEKMDAAEKAAGNLPIFDILPYQQKKVGIVTTGSEIKRTDPGYLHTSTPGKAFRVSDRSDRPGDAGR